MFVKNILLEILTAIQYFTRIPVPNFVSKNYSQELLNKSRTYFPFVGWLVGGICIFVYWSMNYLFSPEISVLGSMIVGILVTGGFHEDGFADVCDGFGGGYTKMQILEIMKDSRLGTYGTIGLIMILSLKYLCLYSLAKIDFLLFASSLLFAHTGSRYLASSTANLLTYVREDSLSKSKPIAEMKLSKARMLYGFGFVGIAMLLLTNPYLIFAFIPAFMGHIYMANYFKKWIGGFTGDCLGSIQQITEILFYLGILSIWKFYPIYGRIWNVEG